MSFYGNIFEKTINHNYTGEGSIEIQITGRIEENPTAVAEKGLYLVLTLSTPVNGPQTTYIPVDILKDTLTTQNTDSIALSLNGDVLSAVVTKIDWSKISDPPGSSDAIKDAIDKRHSHTNKTLLDSLQYKDEHLSYNDKSLAYLQDIPPINGEGDIDLSDYVTTEQLDNKLNDYATLQQLAKYAVIESLEDYQVIIDLSDRITELEENPGTGGGGGGSSSVTNDGVLILYNAQGG